MNRRISRRGFLKGASAAVGAGVLANKGILPARGATGPPQPDVAVATVLDGLIASVKATGPARVKVRAWRVSRPDDVVESDWRLTNPGNVAEIHLRDAAPPGQAWAWQGLVRDTSGKGKAIEDVVRRLPARPAPGEPSAFSFAFGSCVYQKVTVKTFEVAKAQNPLFFVLQGDMGYQDNPEFNPGFQNYDAYAKLFRNFLAHDDLRGLLDWMPFYGMQDDHDYGANGCWAETIEPYAARAYAELIPGARWPEPAYRRWSIGEVDFFQTDNRRYKDPPQAPWENGRYSSVLGATQRSWLLEGLASSSARLKVVFIPMTMTWYWSEEEIKEVQDYITENVPGTVVFLSGDKHVGGFARFPNGTWEMLAGPLDNPGKHLTPAKPNVVWTENGTGRAKSNCVGVVDVDTESAQTVTLRLMGEEGDELHREVVEIEAGPRVGVSVGAG